MARRFEEFYRVKRRDNLGEPDFWNSRFNDIDRRLSSAEDGLANIDDVATRVENIALSRMDLAITPLIQETTGRLREISNLFTADSVSTVDMGTGTKSFVVLENQRNTFAALDYVAIRPDEAPEKSMLGSVVSFNRDTGELLVNIEQATGSGSYHDWRITVSSPPDLAHAGRTDNPHGTTAAQVGTYDSATIDTKDAAVQSGVLSTLRNGVVTARDTLKKLSDALDASVSSLTSALSGKADSGHVHDDRYYTKAEAIAITGTAKVHGSVELVFVSGTQIKLIPNGGGYLMINGVMQTVPAAGVTFTKGGTPGNTTYFVYAYMNGSTMAMEISTTGRALQASTGVWTKSGDTSRTLVGLIRTAGDTGNFLYQENYRYVRSFFNDKGSQSWSRLPSDVTFTATNSSGTEVSSALRVEFLAWDGEFIQFGASGSVSSNTSGTTSNITCTVDNQTVTFGQTPHRSTRIRHGNGGYEDNFGVLGSTSLTGDGYHYVSLCAYVSGGTATFRSETGCSVYSSPRSK